jgi:NAD(P)-dependent dehydrogenase (short-subunit alcohol dehydrogenase family)
VFFLAQAVIPVMAERRFGRIVNIGSVYASHARNGALYEPVLPRDTPEGPMSQFSYHASKGAVVNITRELAVAAGPMGITVNTVSPGMFQTEQTKNLLDKNVVERLTQMTPIPRLGEPAEIGYAIAFLASKEASFITGMDLRVDGGWTLW